MKLKKLNFDFTICQVKSITEIDLTRDIFFIGKTYEEISLVCRTEDTPLCATKRDDGWRGFRIQGTLDFSLTGVLSELSGILAERKIGIFAISTYNTDYVLVKAENYDKAVEALEAADTNLSKATALDNGNINRVAIVGRTMFPRHL